MPLKYLQILLLASIFLLHYIVEHLFPQQKHINNWKNERFNFLIGILNVILNFLPATFLIHLLNLIDTRNLGLLQAVSLPFYISLMITIILLDLWMYTWHRLNHSTSFLWHWHRFHHSDRMMNTTTAVRFHIIELLLSIPGKGLIYLLFGLEYKAVIIYEILFFTSVVFHHSNIYITERFDKIYRIFFASPIMHRVHHSEDPVEQHSNFGALFSIWDKLFKSWHLPNKKKIVFGLKEKGRLQ